MNCLFNKEVTHIYKAYKYRIYPNKEQGRWLNKNFGCCRYVWNFFLSMRKNEYAADYVTVPTSVMKAELTKMRNSQELGWLKEADSTSLQAVIENLELAYKRFFEGLSGYPRFKKKHDNSASYKTKSNNGSITVYNKHVKLPKIGLVKTRVSRPAIGDIKSATVTREATGKYYVSILCELPDTAPLPDTGRNVGIDLGIKNMATCSDGTIKPNVRALESALKKLKHEQRLLSRKTKGSARWEKQRIKVAKLHARVRNIRHDVLQKFSTWLVRSFDVICMEDLNVKGMMRNHHLARAISDVGFATLVKLIEEKCKVIGRRFVKIDRWFASSQMCNSCGHINPDVKDLAIRNWNCPVCGTVHDRDLNAAINILNEGLRILNAAV